MSKENTRFTIVILSDIAIIAMFIQIGWSLDIFGVDPIEFSSAHPTNSHVETPPEDPDQGPNKLEEFSCFTCHDISRYREGDNFPHAHEEHAEMMAGHCHQCHAFEAHVRPVIRRDVCNECH